MPVTAAEAASHIANMNQRKRMSFPASVVQNSKPVYIYNIYQMTHPIILGGIGRWIIPACKEGEPYSKPLVLPGIIVEDFDMADGQGNMGVRPLEGLAVAKAIVGCNGENISGLDALTTNLEWKGVFIAEGEKPTEKELAAAKSRLVRYATLMLHEGDTLFSARDARFPPMPIHREWAAFLKQKREWNSEPEQRTDCPACGTNIRPNLAVCPSCGAVLDMQKAAQFFPEKYGQFAKKEAQSVSTR